MLFLIFVNAVKGTQFINRANFHESQQKQHTVYKLRPLYTNQSLTLEPMQGHALM